MQDIKVKVENLTKKFGDLLVLDDVSFEIERGDFVCIVGPTGCGKTTFLNLLVKLLEPTSGRILIDNEPADPRKHNISFVFQEPSAYPWLTVEQNIRFGLEIKKLPEDVIRQRTNEVLDILGLEKDRSKYPGEFSASTEQRIVIGRSFALHPDLLLMDGGRGQVNIAKEVLEELHLSIPVCGMVKDDHHRTRGLYYEGVEQPIDPHSEGFKLITRVQDEAHRFAIEYHRSLRRKTNVRSVLDEIKGVGPARRKALMRHFDSLSEIKNASVEQLLEIPEINESCAQEIYGFFHKENG